MCDIVTIAIDKSKAAAIQAFRSEGFDVSRNDNRSLAGLFGPEKAAFDVTFDGCSCAFYLDNNETDIDVDRLHKKYRKKGWAEAKIRRALQEARQAPRLIELQRLRASFVTAVEAVVVAARRIHLFSHFYSASSALEDLKHARRQSILLSELVTGQGSFPRDTVLSVSESFSNPVRIKSSDRP